MMPVSSACGTCKHFPQQTDWVDWIFCVCAREQFRNQYAFFFTVFFTFLFFTIYFFMYKKKHNFFLDSRRIMKDNKLITNIKTLREEQMQQTINTNSNDLLCFALLCFALLCFALLCSRYPYFK